MKWLIDLLKGKIKLSFPFTWTGYKKGKTMPKFSQSSLEKLHTCHPILQNLFQEVIKHYDCTILEGHRNREDQDKAFEEGKSHIKWPHGKHNNIPSLAVDVAPYPVDWSKERLNIARFYYLAGIIRGVADQIGIKIRQGVDWDGDDIFTDQRFHDLPHCELIQ